MRPHFAMLYKFKSPAAAPIIMLEPNGRQILTIVGRDDPQSLRQGILLPADMPAAITALNAAVAQDDAQRLKRQQRQQRQQEAQESGDAAPEQDAISLPFFAAHRRPRPARLAPRRPFPPGKPTPPPTAPTARFG